MSPEQAKMVLPVVVVIAAIMATQVIHCKDILALFSFTFIFKAFLEPEFHNTGL